MVLQTDVQARASACGFDTFSASGSELATATVGGIYLLITFVKKMLQIVAISSGSMRKTFVCDASFFLAKLFFC